MDLEIISEQHGDPDKPYRILVTGSRDWQDVETIEKALLEYDDIPWGEVVLVSGACSSGADYLCELYASALGWKVERHPANWELYGKQAGFIRNSEMVVTMPDVCLAFIKDGSRGATHCAALAKQAGIKTIVYIQENEGNTWTDKTIAPK